MKVICDRGALVEALNLVNGAVNVRTPKPILACVKLTAEGATLTLAATDSETGLTLSTARVEVQEPGVALVPVDKLTAIVRESIDPTLTLSVEQDVATITGQDSRFKVFGFPAADFPQVPTFSGDADFEVQAGDLHRLIALTIFATARENSRYAINGVLFERDGNKLAVVATDGHRLALARGACKAAKPDAKASQAIVPTKALNLLLRLFSDGEQTVRVRVADAKVLFATDDATLSSALVEGNFPPYKDVIPKDQDRKATLATDVLISALRRAALLTNEESRGVRLAFSHGGVTFTSRAPEMGEAEVNAPVVEYAGEPIDIGFNPAYLLDALKVVDEDKVTIEMKAPNKPSIVKTSGSFLYVVMPVSVQ